MVVDKPWSRMAPDSRANARLTHLDDMGNYSKKGDFKPGNTFGKGQPNIPVEYRHVQKLHKDIFEKVISKYLSMTVDDFKALTKDPESLGRLPVIEASIVSILGEQMRTGSYQILEWLASRSVGKISDDSGVDHQAEGHKQLVEFFRNRKRSLESKNE